MATPRKGSRNKVAKLNAAVVILDARLARADEITYEIDETANVINLIRQGRLSDSCQVASVDLRRRLASAMAATCRAYVKEMREELRKC